jgi:hypothetical protein
MAWIWDSERTFTFGSNFRRLQGTEHLLRVGAMTDRDGMRGAGCLGSPDRDGTCAMSVSSEARLGARAGRAHPGARDGREHRFLTRAMQRATGRPLGRGGRQPRRSGHRAGRGLVRGARGVTPSEGASRTGSLPPDHLRNPRLRNR